MQSPESSMSITKYVDLLFLIVAKPATSLLIIALLSAIFLLLAKPIILKVKHGRKKVRRKKYVVN